MSIIGLAISAFSFYSYAVGDTEAYIGIPIGVLGIAISLKHAHNAYLGK